MSRLQAFIFVFVILLLQTCFLIVSGYELGKDYAFPTFVLFAIVDWLLVVAGYVLEVVSMEKINE